MDKYKVKGFTLIEMLIVIATFSVIMFGAMQLMQPSRTLFERSFKTEEVSAGQKIIKNYLEDNLRFAQNLDISNKLPEDADLEKDVTRFVCNHYNGYRLNETIPTLTGSLKDYKMGGGTVYVMWIDNRNGGQILSQKFDFTAPDIDPNGTVVVAPTVTAHDRENYAVNKAIYDRYNYLVSVGVTKNDTKDPATLDAKSRDEHSDFVHPVTDTEYYSKFDASLANFSSRNFSFTINAYDTTSKTAPWTDASTDIVYYPSLMTMTASMALINTERIENYLHFDWKSEGTSWKQEFTVPDAASPKKIAPTWCNNYEETHCHLTAHQAADAEDKLDHSTFSSSVTEFEQPDAIRIIYSYPLK